MARLPDWVLAKPSPCRRIQIPIPVIKQVGLIILVFGAPSKRVHSGHGAGGAEDFTEGAFEASPWVIAKALNIREIRIKPGTEGFSET
jgi:hypothetical protein